MKTPTNFSDKIITWYKKHGRHDLPWQKNPTPYRVWISEIMLQQTQVTTVIPYYQKFMRSFPNLKSLATAELDQVLAHWSGLGYYARARNLHKCAQIIHEQFHGLFPKTVEELSQLPGIGRSTAGAIISFSKKIPATILDGNVKRVLTRHFAIEGWPGKTAVHNELWQLAESLTPSKHCHEYNQAMMDLGATICTRSKPTCSVCPLHTTCKAYASGNPTQFPHSKPKTNRARPERESMLLILKRASDQQILLLQRPPAGIWGGLWCFPEYPIDHDIHKICKNDFGCNVVETQRLDCIIHQFSHFQLTIHPVLIEVKSNPRQIMETRPQVWYKLNTDLPGGIPTPMSKILQLLGADNE